MLAGKVARKFRKAFSGEDGSATIEFVLWLPMFMFVFGLIAETSMVFAGQASIMRIVQDTNRALSVGRLQSTTAAENQIRQAIAGFAANAAVTTVIINNVIYSTVVLPVSDLTFSGLVPEFNNVNPTIKAQMMSESAI